MNRRQLLLTALGISLPQTVPTAHAQQTPERGQNLQRLLQGGFLSALAQLPESQRPTRGLWLLIEPPSPFESQPKDPTQQTLLQEITKRLVTAPTLDDLALLYDTQRTRVGAIGTFIPRTMYVLNADKRLGRELPLAELAKTNPLTLLLGTLSDAQFQQLIGDGLGFGDLDASQGSLLRAALPEPLAALPTKGEPDYRLMRTNLPAWQKAWTEHQAKKRTYSEQQIQQGLRLRVFLKTSYTFDDPNPRGFGIGLRPTENDQGWAGNEWKLENGGYRNSEQAQGLGKYFVQVVPARAKRSELAGSTGALEASVALGGVKTVRDVVERVAAASRLALFVDPRFGARKVQFLGEQGVLSRDVVRTLALALSGTWRRVGEAFVLTHELLGRAEYAALQREIISVWVRRMTEATLQSSKRLEQLEWMKNIPFAPGDLSAPTRELLLQSKKTPITWNDLPNRLKLGFEVQFDKYSGPPERMEGESEADADRRMGDFHRQAQRIRASLNDKSKVGLSAELQFAIEMPGTGPMALGEARTPHEASWYQQPPSDPASSVAIAPVKLTETTRAVLLRADTPEQARAVVEKAAALGFNTVYLNVFYNGRPAFATEALPLRTREAKQTLAAAIAAGTENKVSVWAALDLLRWRNDLASKSPEPLPEGFTEDIGFLGETGSQTVKRRMAEDSFENKSRAENFYKYNPGGQGWVSPLEPKVRRTLIQLATDLAKTEGLAGIAFQRTAMSGYIPLDYYYGLDNIEHGYQPEQRLAFLRTGGGDPVDIGNLRSSGMSFSVGNESVSFEVKLPGFDLSSRDASLIKPWQAFRASASRSLMQEIFAAVREVAPHLPLTLRERTMERSFEPWTEAQKLSEITDLSVSMNGQLAQATPTTPNTLIVVSLYDGLRQSGSRVLTAIAEARKQTGAGKAQGIVLELEGGDPLGVLASISRHFSPSGKPF